MAQLSRGQTFANGDQVTGTSLNQLVDAGSLLGGAITEQGTLVGGITVDDFFLIYDQSTTSLKKCNINDILSTGLAFTTPSIIGSAGSDLTATPASGYLFKVVGNASVTGTLAVTGVTTLTGNLIANGTTKASLTADSTVVTPSTGDNSTKPASTAYVQSEITAINRIKAFCKNTGTTINASLNIASVTNPSTGLYTYTFTTPMADSNYVVNITCAFPQVVSTESYDFWVFSQSSTGFSINVVKCVGDYGYSSLTNATAVHISVLK